MRDNVTPWSKLLEKLVLFRLVENAGILWNTKARFQLHESPCSYPEQHKFRWHHQFLLILDEF
jgi:hypothetical protein